MASEYDQPREDLERSADVVVEYGPEAIGRVRKVTTWVAGKAVDATATTLQYSGKAVQFAGKGAQAAGTGISALGTGISSTLGSIPYVGIPFRVLGMGINGVGKGVQFAGKGIEGLGKGVEAAGKGIGKLKQGFNKLGGLLKSGGKIAQLGKVAGGPVGIALMIANNPWVKRIAKGIGALLAYLLLKFGLKFAGAILGAAFGAVTGLPILIIFPPAYPLWVAYWAWRGWNNPVQMLKTVQTAIHYATHPWEVVTKPWSWGKGAFNTVTGGPVEVGGGIPSAAASVVSSIGSAATSVAAGIWGGITSAGGSIFGGLASGLNFVVGGLTSAGVPATVVAIPVVGTAIGIPVVGTLVGINVATSFFSSQQDAIIGGTGDNEAYTISKSGSPERLDNSDLPADIKFAIVLTAKGSALSNISMTDDLQASGDNGNFAINTIDGQPLLQACKEAGTQNPNPPPTSLAAGEAWECILDITATKEAGRNFEDSVVTNKVTVTATPTGQAPITDTASANVFIGAPPTGCPNGWPTDHGSITQGPKGTTSHAAEYAKGWSAIDIGGATTYETPTYATFTGKVRNIVNDLDGGGYGTHVDIEATCNGTFFYARWAHLKYNSIDPATTVGSTVNIGQLIGLVDNTGYSSGDHLHYGIYDPSYTLGIEDYIPQAPTSLSCEDAACGVSW